MSSSFKVTQLSPNDRKVNIRLKILKFINEREVKLKKDNSRHRISTFLAGDDTGTVLLSLWDDQISIASNADEVEISNGYVNEFQGKIYLNVGQFGSIKSLGATPKTSEHFKQDIMKVEEIITKKFNLNLIVKVAEISEIRTVTVKKDNSKHQVLDVLVGDETGCIILSLWDQNVSKINGYNTYLITKAYTTQYNGGYRLNLSKKSEIKSVQKEISVNLLNNLSLLDV
ncbi:MAG: hypothetical protein ACXQS8_04385 [Candidatus Helarchaeales archaeon]